MKKLGFWIICIIPTVNILIMSAFQYIENTYTIGRDYNWWLDLMLILAILIFSGLHYVLAFITPILLYKSKNEFDVRICMSAVSSVLFANAIMFLTQGGPEWYRSYYSFPQYLMVPLYVTMATVVIVSILVFITQKRGIHLMNYFQKKFRYK